jgi:cyclic pyranopterin phosphate synthase
MARDSHGRRIDYLRISVTDRCNLRCGYCMPADTIARLPRAQILDFDEIECVARAAHAEGISRIRITGGEPLVRRGVPDLISRLIGVVGTESVALTTNGTLLGKHARELRAAGLTRVNVSLDSLDAERYRRVTRGGDLSLAMEGLETALDSGFAPVKVNVVATDGVRDEMDGFLDLIVEAGAHVRFIERMHLTAEDRPMPAETPLSADDVLEAVSARSRARGLGAPIPLARADGPYGWGPARYYRFASAGGSLGIIAPMSRHFCAECSRLRLTADGRLRPCLFGDEGVDIRPIAGDVSALRAAIRTAVANRSAGHHVAAPASRSMSQIGG